MECAAAKRPAECAGIERPAECAVSAAQAGLAAAAKDAAMEVPIKVRRFMGRILLHPREKGTGIRVEKRRSEEAGPPLPVEAELEIKTQTELHAAPIVRVGHVQEVARTKVCIDLIELRVIKEVKVFPPKVESGLLVNRELLEEAEIEIEAPWQIQGVAPDIAEREACGNSKSGWVVRERP